MGKPLIGITPGTSEDTLAHGTFRRYVVNAAYAEAINAVGGLPLVLPYQDDAATLVDRLDGVLFTGGADLDPALFGADLVHPATYGISPERDSFELALIRQAISRDMPVLGICRGIQLLNVAFGGTLIQDIPSDYDAAPPVSHRQQEFGIAASEPGHLIELAAGNPLRERLAVSSLPVNSFHHQAIDRIAAGVVPIAWAPDGLIEAVVMPDRAFVLGVQWHPELMFDTHAAHLSPFQALVDAARVRQLSLAGD